MLRTDASQTLGDGLLAELLLPHQGASRLLRPDLPV